MVEKKNNNLSSCFKGSMFSCCGNGFAVSGSEKGAIFSRDKKKTKRLKKDSSLYFITDTCF